MAVWLWQLHRVLVLRDLLPLPVHLRAVPHCEEIIEYWILP